MEGAVEYDLVVFQVWRPVDNCSYLLTGEHRIEEYNVGNDYLLDSASVVPPLDPIPVEPGDVLGIYVNQGQSVDYSVQQCPDDENTVFQIAVTPEMIEQLSVIDICSDGASDVIGVPIVNAIVEESEFLLNAKMVRSGYIASSRAQLINVAMQCELTIHAR